MPLLHRPSSDVRVRALALALAPARPHRQPSRTSAGRVLRALTLSIAGLAVAGAGVAQSNACGSLQNNYGPHDYRDWKDLPQIDPVTNEMSPLQLVEGAHFIDSCEALVRCKRGAIGADLDYTLRAFPNHHRALVSMMNYGELTKRAKPPDARYTVDCYFQRALLWRPKDTIARLIYVTYLNNNKRQADAKRQLEEASRQVGDSAFTIYNVGMVALDLNEIDMAVDAARRSYGAGMRHPALKQRLQAINRWPSDLVLPDDAASAPAAGASAAEPSPAASAPVPAASSAQVG
ncbi:hypothetical protein [Roseateles amylovorans]|uniref:ABC transporter permease n=1 Tax=Roseateles amylovorans TaxID=2978473 RepID=A0ABY6B740_9BURK|nr:hypothetical protein [Roseateles amylovorans]UXH80153.1 hypothetical protein N4261_09835 [Roseateles amylovorans]